jgi:AAA+ ATPase superfamily predicted ATPase
LTKPAEVFDRESEWAQLERFVLNDAESGLAIVYGRRRQGKSLLLQELAAQSQALYWEAAEQSRPQNLAGFSGAWSLFTASRGPVRFRDWEEALATVFTEGRARRLYVFFDEVGYLVDTAPEFPSLLQRHLATRRARTGHTRVVLCGSVIAHMARLLAANAPLRGRHSLQLRVDPFDYRTAAAYWGLGDHPDAAFRLHALVGGTPAYLTYCGGARPVRGDIGRWTIPHLLDPASPLFHEGGLLIAEDASLSDKSLYWSILSAVADGHRRRGDIARAVGRPDGALSGPLDVLAAGGWIEQRPDPLHRRASTMVLTEPMLRTHRVLLRPELPRLRRGQAAAVWDDAQPRLARHVYGPHLEAIAAEWALSFAAPETTGGPVRTAAPAVLRSGGEVHQIDVVVTTPGREDQDLVGAIVECKAERTAMGVAELERLDHVGGLLGPRSIPDLHRLLVSAGGFTGELRRVARRRSEVHLVELDRLYHGT